MTEKGKDIDPLIKVAEPTLTKEELKAKKKQAEV
jgi:hypothetical protein